MKSFEFIDGIDVLKEIQTYHQKTVYEHNNFTIEEGWREKASVAALGAATVAGIGNQISQAPVKQADPVPVVTKAIEPPKSKQEQLKFFLANKAKEAGIVGNELTHFVSQVAHETLNFNRFEEFGSSKYLSKKYDIKYNPKKAKILGNVKPGDGEKYKGRGFIQLTGRYNYRTAGKALGIPLEEQPELASEPIPAAEIAIWYWQQRVQNKISDFSNASVKSVTKGINPSGKGMKSRQDKYQNMVGLNEAGEMPIYYFAYGMLTDPGYMEGAQPVGGAEARNFQFELLQFANVVPTPGAVTYGALWEVSRQKLRQLDSTEGYPNMYDRKTVPVFCAGKRYEANIYSLTPETRNDYFVGSVPSRDYIRTLARGYKIFGIPREQLVQAWEIAKANQLVSDK